MNKIKLYFAQFGASVPTPTMPPPVMKPPVSYSEPPAFKQPKDRSGLIVKILIILIVAIAVVFVSLGFALATRIWDPLWSPFRMNPEKVMEQAILKLKDANQFHFNSSSEFSADDGSSGSKISGSAALEGDLDKADLKNPKFSSNFDIASSISFLSIFNVNFNLKGAVKVVDKDLYFQIENIPMADLFSAFDIDAKAIDGAWIKFSNQSLNELKDESVAPETQTAAFEKFKETLSKYKFYIVSEQFEDEKISGVKTYHYKLSLDKEEIKKFLTEIAKTTAETDSTSVLGLDEEVSQGVDEFFVSANGIDFEVWIGKKDYMVYKFTFDKEFDAASFDPEKSGKVAIKISSEMSKFNQPVTVEIPQNAKDAEEVFASLFVIPKQRAKDSKAMAGLDQLRTLAQTSYASNGSSYAKFKCTGTQENLVCNDIKAQVGFEPVIRQSKAKYCVYVKLLSGNYYCIDSTGVVSESMVNPGSKGYCDWFKFICPPSLD